MQKQAFLIIAHNNFFVLEELIKALESPYIDIFLHLDAKVKTIPSFLENTKVTVLKKRIDTRWGDLSQIITEYVLLEEAYKREYYSYYHIISGTHLPLLPIDNIIDFFEKTKNNTVFFQLGKATKKQEYLKLRRYNFFTRFLADNRSLVSIIAQKIRRAAIVLQSHLGIERNKGVVFYKASNWASFTEEATSYLLDNKDYVMRTFRFSFCGDEFFAPTLLMNSQLKGKVLNYDKYLMLKMGEANPRILTMDDYDDLIASGCLFARKFSDIHRDIIEKICGTYGD